MVYEYINSIHQFGITQNTILLSDDEDLFPPQRIDKLFLGTPDEAELLAAAEVDYTLAISQYLVVE